MIRPLEMICAGTIASYIYEGNLPKIDYKLEPSLNNCIMRCFYSGGGPQITEEVANEVITKFGATQLFLDRKDFDENHLKIAYAQNLEVLGLHELATTKMFHLEERDEDDERPIPIDIIDTLKRFLNPESRKTLKHLSIYGHELVFSRGWITKMSQLLPSLTSLDIRFCSLTTLHVSTLGNFFQQITKLDISATDLNNLNGISKLKNLEILNMLDMEFKKKDDLMELFELKKLRVLDISGEELENVKTIKYYLECEKFLPELSFIDCSLNDITGNMLTKLVKTHPKLEVVGLIGTPIEKTVESDDFDEDVEFLCLTDLKRGIESLQHYTTSMRLKKVAKTLIGIDNLLEHNYEEQKEDELFECFNTVIRIMGMNWVEYIYFLAVQVLNELCREERMEKFNYNEKQDLIRVLVNVCETPWEKENEDEENWRYRIHELSWELLSEDAILKNSEKNLDVLCERAALIVEKSTDVNQTQIFDCMYILEECLEKMTPWRRERLSENHVLKQNILLLISQRHFRYFIADLDSLDSCMNVFCKLSCEYPENYRLASVNCIKVFLRFVNRFQQDPDIQVNILTMLASCIINMEVDVYKEFFKKTEFDTLLQLMLEKNTKRQKSAVFLLILAFWKRETGITITEDQMEDQFSDVLVAINAYEIPKNSNDDNKLGVFEWIVSTSKCLDTILWAEWILSYFAGDKVAPNAKKQKIG